MDWDEARRKLSGARGQEYWRSLNDLAGTEEFNRWLDDEFPNRSSLLDIDRRNFLKFMGASLALAGLTGCRSLPQEQIVPYVHAPEEIVPGKALQFATAVSLGGYATGVLATSNMGRPTKIEGNPKHPASLGSTDVFAQAAVLDLYDPSRIREVAHRGQVATMDEFVTAARAALTPGIGDGFRILSGAVTSPTLTAQIERLLARIPGARWHRYEPIHRDAVRAGAQLAFGAAAEPVYRFDQARVIFSLDADFLASMPGSVRYARDFASGRRMRAGVTTANRLYALECTPTLTGAMADHKLAIRSADVAAVAAAVARELGVDAPAAALPAGVSAAWVSALAKDLRANTGGSVVLAGDWQPPAVHALAHAMNAVLGSTGRTVVYTVPVEADPASHLSSIADLSRDLDAGKVRFLLILGGNPAYTAPADLGLASKLLKVPTSVYLGLQDNETAATCEWLIPESHSLESWSDARAYDGTVSVVQPLIEPLYASHSAHELIATLSREPRPGYDIVRSHWQMDRKVTGPQFERFWRTALHEGTVPDTASAPVTVNVLPGLAQRIGALPAAAQGIEINLRPDPTVWDGRYADNAWLQELPKPLTRLTWDNAALVSPATARTLGLAAGDMVELAAGGRKVTAAVWVQPGHTSGAVTVHLGYGRRRAGQVGSETGFDGYQLRTSTAQWTIPAATVRKVRGSYELITTQDHHALDVKDIGSLQDREPIWNGTLDEFIKHPSLEPESAHEVEEPASIYPEHPYPDYSWGMAIDLTLCTGCNACAIACQAENNIPVVGKNEVARGRHMHWMRIDRYFKGSVDNPATLHQPVPCMHCERAPCEPVCPVAATTHSHEGLNQMVYNRCVGTRYCSNNCPYRVRRFNFFKYAAGQPDHAPGNYDIPVMQLLANPNVTVRGRGVMEKCTYCVQRISAARIEAKKAGRPIADGEVVTACQQVCPPKAITFGDINDPKSEISQARKQPHNYSLLAHLNTKPRTTYLAKVRNPNPELETE